MPTVPGLRSQGLMMIERNVFLGENHSPTRS